MYYKKINKCRICLDKNLKEVFNLGKQVIASYFPKKKEKDYRKIPLVLVKCEKCELVQLQHTVDSTKLYTNNYGYRSGINSSMTKHLQNITKYIKKNYEIKKNDTILDIGCNDGTLLKSYNRNDIYYVGIDPVAKKFKKFYSKKFLIKANYFNSQNYFKIIRNKAKIITSISMFYDLPDPNKFVEDIKKILAPNGIWILEQSYMPFMLKTNSFDTICHEHLEYYCLKQINHLMLKNNLKIINVFFNEINGGSFQVHVAHKNSTIKENLVKIRKILNKEKKLKIDFEFKKLKKNIVKIKNNLLKHLSEYKNLNKKVFVYGASTKGNTLLQYFNINKKLILAAAERNSEKFGLETPGTRIPIISEDQMRKSSPDFLLVLPWHFKGEFIKRERTFLNKIKFIFPLPTLTIL
jgi:SAM-dependent methyltransferase